jgi:hypothetical protein
MKPITLRRSSAQTRERPAETDTRFRPFVERYGPPFETFIERFATGADDDECLPRRFEQSYCASFESRRDVIGHLTALDQWESDIAELCRAHRIPEDSASIDETLLWQYVTEGWIVLVGRDERYHVFDK